MNHDDDDLTDDHVIALYRYLLGRAPENANTIAAFKSYYPDLAAGRRAILTSDEFRRTHAALTQPDHAAAQLALAFLRRAGGEATFAPPAHPAAAALTTIATNLPAARLALVQGDRDADIASLAPLGPGACVLHIAPGFPECLPQIATLPTGATLFRLDIDPSRLARLLQSQGLAPDWLVQLDPVETGLALAPQAVILTARHLTPGLDGAYETVAGFPDFALHFAGGWHLPVSYAAPAAAPPVPDPEEYPALAIAAIVRNEEAALPHMLRSVLPIASFAVIADTGSTDGTLAAARETLAASGKPHRLASVPAGPFDDMRNAALDLVPDWIEWVLMLDADEALRPEDHAPLLALLGDQATDVFSLPRYNYPTEAGEGPVAPYPDRQLRLFRNDPRIRYSGTVHETIRGARTTRLPLDAAAIGLARGGPHIHHLVRRFRTPEEEAKKQRFYKTLAIDA